MKNILFATNNKTKKLHLNNIFSSFGLEILSLNDFGITQKVEENGRDEIENALIKARFYSKIAGIPTLADDAGLYMRALGGEPGVQARRWGGVFSDDVSDEEWMDYFMKRMEAVAASERDGHFNVARAVVTPSGEEFTFSVRYDFNVAVEPKKEYLSPGWPMSAVCIDSKFNKYWPELTAEENSYYEGQAIENFAKIIKEIFK